MFAYVKFLPPDNSCAVVATSQIRKFKLPIDKFKQYKVTDGKTIKKGLIIRVKDSDNELLDLISSGKRLPIPPGHLQKSCTEESDLESIQPQEEVDETIKVQAILQKKLAVRQQKLMEMEKNFTETKENCQNASNLHFDLKSSQVEAESMSTNEATIMEKDLNIPKNDPKNTSPKKLKVLNDALLEQKLKYALIESAKDLAETTSEIGTVSTPPFSHENDIDKEQEKIVVDLKESINSAKAEKPRKKRKKMIRKCWKLQKLK